MEKIKIVCKTCGKTFEKFPSEVKRGEGKYCSRECYLKESKTNPKKQRILKVCQTCNCEFYIKPSSTFRKFCSRKCYATYAKTIPHTKDWTDKQSKALKGRKITWTNKISDAMKGKRHSLESKLARSEFSKGENNPFFGKQHKIETRKQISASHQGIPTEEWNGFTKPLYVQIRNSQKHMNWAQSVFKRDNYRDWFSGIKGNGNLNAHHVVRFKDLFEQYNIQSFEQAMECEALWDINNGVTMIDTSHNAYHSMWG
jgi:hypothetical protein